MDELQSWQIIITYSIVAVAIYATGIVSGLLQQRRKIAQWRSRCSKLEYELASLQKREARNIDEIKPVEKAA